MKKHEPTSMERCATWDGWECPVCRRRMSAMEAMLLKSGGPPPPCTGIPAAPPTGDAR